MSALELPPKTDDPRALKALNAALAKLSAEERVAWALEHTPGKHVMSSSFGAQSAVSLHLVTRQKPDIPVVLIDTGYLFPETYRFVDELSERFALNLKVYRPRIGISWMEARYGRLWEQGLEGLDRYNSIRKVHPLADWSDRDVGMYLQRHGLPYHPLWEQGYVSIGDTHTSRRWEPGMDPEDTRFFGLKRECGLHSIA